MSSYRVVVIRTAETPVPSASAASTRAALTAAQLDELTASTEQVLAAAREALAA